MLFQNILFLKEFLSCNGCFGLFTKIKKGSGLAFGAHFHHEKCSLFNTLSPSPDKVSMPYLFSSQDIKQNVLLSS